VKIDACGSGQGNLYTSLMFESNFLHLVKAEKTAYQSSSGAYSTDFH
jgi:hypothetical protein